MSNEKHQCEGWCEPSKTHDAHRCTNPGKYYHEGKFYCGIHYPVFVQSRFKRSTERIRNRNAVRNRYAKCAKACEGFTDPMELRRQRDEAIRLLRYLSCVKGVSDTVAWYNCTKGVRALLETIDKGEPK